MSGQLNTRKSRDGEANRWIVATFCCKSARKCLKCLHDKLCHLYFFLCDICLEMVCTLCIQFCTQCRAGRITVDQETQCTYMGAYKHMIIWQLGLDATKMDFIIGDIHALFGRLWEIWGADLRLPSCEVWRCVSNLRDFICKVNVEDISHTFSYTIDLGNEIDCCSVKNCWLLNAEQK
jgi:hypothetical protein